jgi:succinate-semialdehyde dehydrogenase/glutarate-semialdehyde dehydrogenase
MEKRKLYLNNTWVDLETHFHVSDPGNGENLAQVPAAGAHEAEQALENAWAALSVWKGLTGIQRGDYLLAITDVLRRRHEELATVITKENGKPLGESRGEVNMAIDHLRWFAEEARRGYGRIVPNQASGKRHLVLKEPIGVVAAIAPWNFPLVLAARKVAPSLAAGCPTILRPASQTPSCAVILAEAVEEAGLPAGAFQLIAGPAQPIVQTFMDSPKCAKITFTGSTEVGKKLVEASSKRLTKLSLELGGHAPVIAFADADLDKAVEAAAVTKFRNTGQSCIASNRIYVERSVYEAFLERFVAKAKALKVGYGLEEGVDLGPLVNEEGLNTALEHIEDAKRAGGRILCGGKKADPAPGRPEQGFYLEPTVIADVPPQAVCMTEETFAPVAPVIPFDSEEEVVRKANETRYGLAAYAYTSNLNRAFRLAEQLEAGTVCINDAVPASSNCPFGGMKESGQGRELGIEGMEAFLETKHVSFANMD